ncbi:EAL domain-containing protein [Sporosarcina sp. CAU 1771]
MKHCEICMPENLNYQIRFSGEENLKHLPQISSYLVKNDLLISKQSKALTVKEAAVSGLIDYFHDVMNIQDISFRLDKGNWRPIEDITESLNLQWIDAVIFNGLVSFHIQPIVNASGDIYAHEMLARFQDVNGDAMGPYDVFQAAKKRNRTYALDRICRMSAVRSAASVNTKVFINFIPTSIYSPEHCLRSTVELANELGIEPSRFVFEVVETEKVDDLAHLKRILTYYRQKGFRYALDDVGEGFSTIDVLEQLAPHYMKLDMKFVQGVSKDIDKQNAANNILQSALQIGAIPLAEGIEEEEDFVWLRDKGYQLFQGYLFGKPAPIHEH